MKSWNVKIFKIIKISFWLTVVFYGYLLQGGTVIECLECHENVLINELRKHQEEVHGIKKKVLDECPLLFCSVHCQTAVVYQRCFKSSRKSLLFFLRLNLNSCIFDISLYQECHSRLVSLLTTQEKITKIQPSF